MFLYLFVVHFQFLRWFVQEFSSFVIISIYSLFQSYRWFVEDFSQVCAISILILSTRISSMQKSIACHQSKLVKAKHNVILILVSSKWLIPYSRDSTKFLISFVHFSFRSSKLFQLYHFKASSNHCKASPGVLFNFPFRLIILLLSKFFMEDQHGGSSRIPFILQLFFKISLGVKIRQAIL